MKTTLDSVKNVVLIITFMVLAPPIFGQKTTAWKAPEEANNVENPLKGNSDAIAEGKKLFNNMCGICHGAKGKGDGVAGMSLKPRPTNFTTAAIQSQSDGAIYWKITEGRAPMATYKTVLTDEQRWQLVNYIRTFSK